ncbi:hypothetical protein ORI20_05495 [Mycobacterium sp. CVI_P3]|uniref:PASTA domain-containing protein n=1 Tax=Mycobacterium pinniadriaticum TaxID=2994102 RepID=A0ABT3S9F6_9MYCO|nr:hypothetical protein [Mycobacterium pinniadriaticum]MCX2929717.1 hypothetical protein [Mycobacterium pinniadriaticum]MCX2936141.1 hypothetical protein [Mycobacterium pinniadriaticum]
MKRLILVAAGALAAGSAAAALSMGSSSADPNAGGTLNILGEPYYKAVAILHAQGVSTVFGGSVGSDVPQAKCIVQSQKYLASGKMQLMLNCTESAQPEAPPSGSSGSAPAQQFPSDGGSRPTPGAPGTVTVTPTQVG